MDLYYEYEPLFLKNNPVFVKKFIQHFSCGRVHWHEAVELLYFTQGKNKPTTPSKSQGRKGAVKIKSKYIGIIYAFKKTVARITCNISNIIPAINIGSIGNDGINFLLHSGHLPPENLIKMVSKSLYILNIL